MRVCERDALSLDNGLKRPLTPVKRGRVVEVHALRVLLPLVESSVSHNDLALKNMPTATSADTGCVPYCPPYRGENQVALGTGDSSANPLSARGVLLQQVILPHNLIERLLVG